MIGKHCLVTGGTAGIGLATARELVRKGASVTIVGRDSARGESAVAAIRAATGRDTIDFVAADLSDQRRLRAFATAFRERRPKLDVLINNAGGLFGRRRLSADGIEMTFALNHLNYFLLTHLLLPSLRAAAPSTIVNVASEAHRGVSLHFDNLQGEVRYNRWLAYKRSKLANLMFTYELSAAWWAKASRRTRCTPGSSPRTSAFAMLSFRAYCGGSGNSRRLAWKREQRQASTSPVRRTSLE